MKMTRTSFGIVLCLSITAFGLTPVSYVMASNDKTSIEEVKKETSELTETLKAYTADKRDEALEESNAAMDRLDERIDTLEARVDDSWDEMNQAVRDKARASLKTLRKERTDVAEWYGSMKTSSQGAWEEMKTGFSNAYSDLEKAWEKAEVEFTPEKDQKTP
jgi:hypothetical protein